MMSIPDPLSIDDRQTLVIQEESSESTDSASAERRASYRCAVLADHQTAILRVRRKEFSVKIVDESAGGMGILVEKKTDLRSGDVVTVTSFSGRLEARVAYVQKSGQAFRVGLKRLRESSYAGHRWASGKGQLGLVLITAIVACGFGLFGLDRLETPARLAKNKPSAAKELSTARREIIDQIVDEMVDTLAVLNKQPAGANRLTEKKIEAIQSASKRIHSQLNADGK